MRKSAFTLAEVLITLGIIGVVAAMTLPALVNNYKEKQLVTQTKKTYSNIENAIRLAQQDLGSLGDNTILFDVTQTHAQAAQKFSKYFNGAKVCENKNQKGCSQYFYKIKYAVAYGGSGDTTKAFGLDSYPKILLTDGAVLSIQQESSCYRVFNDCKQDANGNCIKDENGDIIQTQNVGRNCARIYMDVNGIKRPNQFGADVYNIAVMTDNLVPSTWTPYGGKSLINILTGKDKLEYENYKEGAKL